MKPVPFNIRTFQVQELEEISCVRDSDLPLDVPAQLINIVWKILSAKEAQCLRKEAAADFY